MSSDDSSTILDDWQRRRDRLVLKCHDDGSLPDVQVQLFNYLIERYQGSEQAAASPAFPMPEGTHVNQRAIVVHHHVDNFGGGAKNAREAKDRVGAILARMQRAAAGDFDESAEEPFTPPRHEVSALLWNTIVRRIHWGLKPDRLMRRALQSSPFLPGTALQHLFDRIERSRVRGGKLFRSDLNAANLLLSCENESVYTFAARAWRNRVVQGLNDAIANQLGEFWIAGKFRDKKLTRLRFELADEQPLVRIRAIEILGQIGSLDDIGLLSDLFEVSADEHDERDVIIKAMRRLAELVPGCVIDSKGVSSFHDGES